MCVDSAATRPVALLNLAVFAHKDGCSLSGDVSSSSRLAMTRSPDNGRRVRASMETQEDS